MIYLIDNYDSFTYNLVDYFQKLSQQVIVKTPEETTVEMIKAISPTHLVISPGPKSPKEANIAVDMIRAFYQTLPILGICLGHQAIGHVFGATVTRAKRPVHGKVSKIFHDSLGMFVDLPNPFPATRYHSLIVQRATITEPLAVTAETSDGEVMGIRSLEMKIEGVQFHPESIATEHGAKLFQNFLATHLAKGNKI